LGSANKHNIVNATVDALRILRSPAQFASKRTLPLEHIDHQTRSKTEASPLSRRVGVAEATTETAGGEAAGQES